MKRTSKALWKGTGKEGSGVLNSQSGALQDLPYSFKLRFENEDGTKGTNPEELIAAAHAGCFAMALAVQLQGAGYTADSLDVSATLKMIKDDKGWVADTMNLVLNAQVPDISQEKFEELAGNAKNGCPISRSLKCDIILEATLSS